MSLLSIRTQYVKISGRYDLVVDTSAYADNGADFFIQSGQRYIQALLLNTQSEARILRYLAPDTNRISFSDCQSVSNVWIRERALIESGTLTIGDRYQITTQSLLDFLDDGATSSDVGTIFTATSSTLTMTANDSVVRLSYDDNEEGFQLSKQERVALINSTLENGGLSTADLPRYYAIDMIRDADVEGTEILRGILLAAPALHGYSLVLEGVFNPKKLESDSDINFWTEQYPDLLLLAGFRSMEMFYRNTQGVKDFEEFIRTARRGMDWEIVQETIQGINQVRG